MSEAGHMGKLSYVYDELGNHSATTLRDFRTINILYSGSRHLHQARVKVEIYMDKNVREVWNIDTLLKRSKNTSYKESVLMRDEIVFKFFKDNNLINIEPFDDNGRIKRDLIIYVSDLTSEGLKLLSWEDCAPEFKLPPVLKWHNYLDRGGKVENISLLKKGLEQLRKKEQS